MSFSQLLQADNVAVVTGASSGIGRAASLFFAQKGLHVWMVDIDAEELPLAKDYVETTAGSDGKVFAEIVDVSDATAVEALSQKVFSVSGKVNILMNNAAIHAATDDYATALGDVTAIRKVLDVNTFGPIHGCVSFVPKMKDSKETGIIINTGSKQGITMPPGNCSYNVSKAALKCYTEALEHELRNLDGGRLRAALLVPGWVNTSIQRKYLKVQALNRGEVLDEGSVFFSEDKPQSGAWMPSQVIQFMVDELDKGRFYIICPDNDVDRETDNIRMTWTMQDITMNRPPLSRWHPEYAEQFSAFLKESREAVDK